MFAFLFRPSSHFNLANLFTFVNIAMGLIAIYLITLDAFFYAIVAAWIGGAFDIFDGKIARKYRLSNEFGIQADSFADFVSFVLVPALLIFNLITKNMPPFDSYVLIAGVVFIGYIISGLRRLITFNISARAGEVEKYFTGVPTPLGAILMWLLYLSWTYEIITSFWLMLIASTIIAWLLNSKIKIPHP